MSHTLYLLRHAKAEPWSPGINDHARPLAPKGWDHMSALVTALGDSFELPQRVLCSTSQRTRETLEPLLDAWPALTGVTRFTDDIYEASAGMLHALAEAAFDEVESLLMVGHNPGFEQLLMAVTRRDDTSEIYKMPTGTWAAIAFSKGYRASVGDGRLRDWKTRKSLQAQAA